MGLEWRKFLIFHKSAKAVFLLKNHHFPYSMLIYCHIL